MIALFCKRFENTAQNYRSFVRCFFALILSSETCFVLAKPANSSFEVSFPLISLSPARGERAFYFFMET